MIDQRRDMRYRVRYLTTLELSVYVEAEDEETAEDFAMAVGDRYLSTVDGDGQYILAYADLDGIVPITTCGGDSDESDA
jgi:hypothetical protein